jgi:hypothetical protein
LSGWQKNDIIIQENLPKNQQKTSKKTNPTDFCLAAAGSAPSTISTKRQL